MYTSNDLMVPYRAIPTLRRLRGPRWQALVERVAALPETHEETLAFILMMVRLNGCMSCETDSYRAMRGCSACAAQTLRRFKGSDDDLLRSYEIALREIRGFVASRPPIMAALAYPPGEVV
mgnify:CR=1 FL=1